MEHIYVLVNKKTKRFYVGRSKSPQHRISVHLSNLKRGKHENQLMQEDYKKYGDKSFVWCVVHSGDGFTRNSVEGFWMIKLMTYNDKYGYNHKDPFFTHKTGRKTKNYKTAVNENTFINKIKTFVRRKRCYIHCLIIEYCSRKGFLA